MTRILILDGETNQALATARALAKKKYILYSASSIRMNITAFSRYIAKSYYILGEDSETAKRILEICINNKIQVVLPMTERSCGYLQLCYPMFDQYEIKIGTVPIDILTKATDKFMTFQVCKQLNINMPKTDLLSQIIESELAFPVIVKNRISNEFINGRYIRGGPPKFVHDMQQWDTVKRLIPKNDHHRYIVQDIIEGRSVGIFAMAEDGKAYGLFSHSRIRDINPTGSGSSLRESRKLLPSEAELAKRIVKHLNWTGPIMLEFMENDNGLYLIEINGRMWGSLQLAIDAGINYPVIWQYILRKNPIPPKYLKRSYPKVVLRYLTGDLKRFVYIIKGRPSGYVGPFPTIPQGFIELLSSQPKGTKYELLRIDDPLPFVISILQSAFL